MKISIEKFDKLAELLSETVLQKGISNLCEYYNQLRNDGRVKKLSTRFVFNLLYLIPSEKRTDLVWSLYDDGIHDEHIERYLTKILKPFFSFL